VEGGDVADQILGPGGVFRKHRHLNRRTAVLLLASAAIAIDASGAYGAAQPADTNPNREIVITAPLFRDLAPERDLDEEAIGSYGVSTIDQLLGEVQSEVGDPDDQPLVLVNGRRINNLDEIGALPVEALRDVQVLPRGSAVRLGGRSGQRVISLTLRRRFSAETLTAASSAATEGEWHSKRGEAIFTRIHGETRANVTLRGRDDSRLLESDRNVIQPAPRLPFSLGGNVISFPDLLGEIDPLLSAAAGQVITVAPVTGASNPTLADFAKGANVAAVTDNGAFRTLRPDTRNFDLNGSFATALAPWLTASTMVRLSRNTADGLRGLPSLLFVLPATNAASPFSRDVGLAVYDPKPLRSRTTQKIAQGEVTLDANWGNWIGNLNARHSRSTDVSLTDRQTGPASVRLADSFDPFTSDLASFFTIGTDRVISRTTTTLAQTSVTGPAATLPAGPLQTTFEGVAQWDHLRGSSTFSQLSDRDVRRSQQGFRAAVDVPLTSRDSGFGAAIGDLDATAEYGLNHYSDAGSLHRRSVSLAWEPRPPLRLFGSIERSALPAPLTALGAPAIVTPGVRMFDPLTGQTVDVVQITGGTPDLKVQTTTIRRLTGLLRLVPKLSLQLNAEYTDTDRRNFVSALPEASAAVELAFPNRFIRDANGVLTTVDLRPVNFDSDREKRLRWGLSMNAKIGGGRVHSGTGLSGASQPTTYFQLTMNHTMVFSDDIVIRTGLAPVNLLNGGAIGIGGGRVRHQVDATAALTSGGLGVRMGVTWRGPSELLSRFNDVTDTLHFSSLLSVNLRAFADMKRFAPHAAWAKGLRLSLDVVNLTDHRQTVRDSFGNTPLQYQPAYRDPLGRTIEIELRKVF
jgi:hypothetical protein